MKHFISIILLLSLSNFIYAQSEDSLKPVKGNFTTELNFNPFKGELSLNNAISQIRGRYFINNDLALRVGLGLNFQDSSAVSGDPYGENTNYKELKYKSNSFDLSLGIEKHFAGTRRLSPYVGLEVTYGNKSNQFKEKTNQYELDVKNGWTETIYQYFNGSSFNSTTVYTRHHNQAYTRFGASAIAGFDFYISSKFYFGYEFNLSYVKTKFKKPEIEFTGNYTQNNDYNFKNDESSFFGAKLFNGIRLGYSF